MINDYLGIEEYVEGMGNIYPISIAEYDRFKFLAEKYLIPDKRSIESTIGQKLDFSLLEIIICQIKQFEIAEDETLLNAFIGDSDKKFYKNLNKVDYKYKMNMEEFKEILEMTLKCKVIIDEENMKVKLEKSVLDDDEINSENFEEYRKVVMRQNLLFAPLYYDDFILQSMLEQLREKQRTVKEEASDLEAILQILSLKKGIHPKDFKEYTYYQVMAEFARFQTLENYDWVKLIQTSGYGSKDVEVPKLDKKIDLNRHPEEFDFNQPVVGENDEKIQNK
ncbi:hypothetical protein [Clostridium sardiniense]|uniref:hypothetical protein n=1 Tax=Clostridium sardiniense TaxID=29369 RepID=UPI001959FE17|nr:hypothetical protein [Clostridium sardiniense]MBM7835736.1 hypothetical protein [Clostridium sardiniense]